MHKIDSPNATGAGEFTDGDELLGVEATEVWSKWLNTVQRELIAILTAAGIAPSAANDAQVTAAINVLLAAHTALTAPHQATSLATASRLMLRDAAGRAQVATPSAAADIATKGYIDTHAALSNPHAAVSAATPNRLMLRDANGRSQVVAPVSSADVVNLAYLTGLFDYIYSQNGWYQLPGGIIVQWGRVWVDVDQIVTVTLPLEYPTSHWVAYACGPTGVGVGSVHGLWGADPYSLTQIRVSNDGDAGTGSWLSIGR